jgi:hypothetical protein
MLLLTYGVVGGFGLGLIFLPAVVCVGHYFESKARTGIVETTTKQILQKYCVIMSILLQVFLLSYCISVILNLRFAMILLQHTIFAAVKIE